MKIAREEVRLRSNVIRIIKDHAAKCSRLNPGESRWCRHGTELRQLFSDLDLRVKQALLHPTSAKRTCACFGTPLTLNEVLREWTFTFYIGRQGYKQLYDWGIEPRKEPRPVTVIHEAVTFLVNFMKARPEIVEGYPWSICDRGGYSNVFGDRLPVEGKSVNDCPNVLRGEGWARFRLNPHWVCWSTHADDCENRGDLDGQWVTCYHASTIECLGSQMRHGLQSFSWGCGGRGQKEKESLVYFFKGEHADKHLMSYSDVVYECSSGWLYQVVWEVIANTHAAVATRREHQSMYPRYAFRERALWIRVLSFDEDVLAKEKIVSLRPGLFFPLEVDYKF